ncbi:ferredoxin reductase family protein [Jidongwangia harbinensis]|uniref:ferredoxin reductase family protein n=1 Tax=Jidongwangia harbinensis TaxID=2878561 RepID=UPI001CDA2BC8|nr:ferredoxin reductase family protein [Jidongwangia harbinensis]MCA2214375.1 ferredoxin reductase family protein [Jidongwangia harbinensis]
MTAADETLTRPGRLTGRPGTLLPGRHPATLARAVLVAFVLINVVVVEALFVTSDVASKHVLIDVGKFFGLHVALVMIFQLLLVARLPWLDRRIGMDRLTAWHRWVGFTLLWTLILHVTFIVLGYARRYATPVPRQVVSLAGSFPVLLGMAALAVIVVVAGLSVRYARRRLQYETWHALHLALYLAVTLALVHQMFEVSTFTSSALATAYWWSLWAFAGLALLGGRVVLPLWRNARHRLRVAAVVPESDTVVSVHLRGRHLDRMPARAGQFFVWRFLSAGRWWQANPFSLSAAPDGRSLRLTAKAVGSGSAGLRHVPVGTRVFAEGPYGAFTALQRVTDATLLIAGGVGVTPIRALLEELDGSVVVLYRVPTRADAVLLAELEALARMRGARLHVLTGRTGAGSPPNTPFAPENLHALVPDITGRDVYVCGPPAMTDAVLRSLRALRVPRRQVHAERFSLAG